MKARNVIILIISLIIVLTLSLLAFLYRDRLFTFVTRQPGGQQTATETDTGICITEHVGTIKTTSAGCNPSVGGVEWFSDSEVGQALLVVAADNISKQRKQQTTSPQAQGTTSPQAAPVVACNPDPNFIGPPEQVCQPMIECHRASGLVRAISINADAKRIQTFERQCARDYDGTLK